MVQSAVSSTARALERELGTRLLGRTTHRVALTPAGEAFVPAARDAPGRRAGPGSDRCRTGAAARAGDGRRMQGVWAGIHYALAALRAEHPGEAPFGVIPANTRRGSASMTAAGTPRGRHGRDDIAFVGRPSRQAAPSCIATARSGGVAAPLR
ncbi:LysR family transcriptional regulator [Streptomyces sp. NPDC001633]|uniref:LysR family transcriptional regulator n=1 Tax=Streptomyces sp. NPDC001633 TaxID=3364595 RepID=UPI0036C9467B